MLTIVGVAELHRFNTRLSHKFTSAFGSIPYVEFSDCRSIHNPRHGRCLLRTDSHWPCRRAQPLGNASKLLERSRKRVVPRRCSWDRSLAAHSPPSVGNRKSGHSQNNHTRI
jgi:hypothetical protein